MLKYPHNTFTLIQFAFKTTKPCAVGQLTANSREKLVAPDAAIYGN
jgi:hypothetical protein